MTINHGVEVLKNLLREAWARFVLPEKIAPSKWAEQHRQISAMTAEMSGKWSWALFPHMRGIIDSFFEPGVTGIRCQKSTQAGWSETLATWLGYIIDVMPAPIIVLFPKEKKAKEFNLERFEPMVNATPRLAAKVPLKSREKGITQTFKLFPGGFLKFVHSHSADEVKSSSARYGVVEEPDECERDVRGQGSTVKLLKERLKTYFDSFSIMGGSPTLEELSAITDEMQFSDKRKWFAACHHCKSLVALDGEAWELVKCPETSRATTRCTASTRPSRRTWSARTAAGCGPISSARATRARRRRTAAAGSRRRRSTGSPASTSAT
jgi:phage terminase large subunit GpA-like protein